MCVLKSFVQLILTECFYFSPQVMAHSTPQGILDDVAMVS